MIFAQDPGRIQILTGSIDDTVPGTWYELADLKQGDTLYVRGQGESGNLDPLVAIVDSDADLAAVGPAFRADVQKAIDAGRDPLTVIPEFANSYFLAWDDDTGGGLDAATELVVPADGLYHVLITRSPLRDTFGQISTDVGDQRT